MAEKIAVITGGTKGLGLALSREYARAGYEVVALYAKDEEAARRLSEEFERGPQSGRCLKLDVSQKSPDWSIWKDAREIVLINNAAQAFVPTALHLLSWDEIQAQLDVTLKGSFLAIQSLYRLPRPAPRRTVVNVLSEVTLGDSPKGFLAYSLAKMALLQLSRTWAQEQSAQHLRLLSVSPGYMETALTEAWPESLRAALKKPEAPSIAEVARRIRELSEDERLPARGENYPV